MKPNEHIDKLIAELTDWRGKTFAGIRRIILTVDPEIVEEWKWMGTSVWNLTSHKLSWPVKALVSVAWHCSEHCNRFGLPTPPEEAYLLGSG